VLVDHAGGSFGKQMQRADKAGADVALIVGEEEMAEGSVTVRLLRASEPTQQRVPLEAVVATVERLATEDVS
jgi:histidyl-tRNA synthetase